MSTFDAIREVPLDQAYDVVAQYVDYDANARFSHPIHGVAHILCYIPIYHNDPEPAGSQ